jgi:hypothetical protein
MTFDEWALEQGRANRDCRVEPHLPCTPLPFDLTCQACYDSDMELYNKVKDART